TSDLQRDVERSRTIDWSFAPNAILNRLAFEEFHRIKVFAALGAKMEDRRNVAVTKLRGGACLREKTLTTRFIREVTWMNHFKRDFAAQVCVECFVSHAHGAAAELDWSTIITSDQLVLIETIWTNSVIDVFVAQGGVHQKTDPKRFCVSGGAQSRSTLRAD